MQGHGGDAVQVNVGIIALPSLPGGGGEKWCEGGVAMVLEPMHAMPGEAAEDERRRGVLPAPGIVATLGTLGVLRIEDTAAALASGAGHELESSGTGTAQGAIGLWLAQHTNRTHRRIEQIQRKKGTHGEYLTRLDGNRKQSWAKSGVLSVVEP